MSNFKLGGTVGTQIRWCAVRSVNYFELGPVRVFAKTHNQFLKLTYSVKEIACEFKSLEFWKQVGDRRDII